MTTTTGPVTGRRPSPPTMTALPRLLARFLPFYLRHLTGQPYRAATSGTKVTGLVAAPALRHHIAMYDAVLELMLRGYADLTGLRMRPEAGQVAVRLMHLGFAFDDELERRTADGLALEFDAVFGGAGVRRPLAEWRDFMQDFDTYPAIREFLFSYVTALYASHRQASHGAGPAAGFDDLVAAEWDSGGLLVALAHVIGRFHSCPPPDDVVRQFSSLGLTAKFADDIVDLRSDLAAGRPNLLAAVAGEDELDLARMRSALEAHQPMSSRWWRQNCPHSYARLSEVYRQHAAALTSRWLRLANGLMWTPALIGHSSVTDSRGRV